MTRRLSFLFLLFALTSATFESCQSGFSVEGDVLSDNAVGFEPYTRTFLVVYVETTEDGSKVKAQRYDETGSTIDTWYTLQDGPETKMAPVVAFGRQWLIVWNMDITDGHILMAITISQGVMGELFRITSPRDFDDSPRLAYNYLLDQFALVSQRPNNGYRPVIRLLDGDGVNVPNITEYVANTTDFIQLTPDVVYNSDSNDYVMTWTSAHGSSDQISNILGQRFSATLEPLSDIVTVGEAQSPSGIYSLRDHSASIVYNNIDKEYLLVWQSQNNEADSFISGPSKVHLRILDLNLTETENSDLYEVEFLGNSSSQPRAAFSSRTNEYVIAYVSESDSKEIFLRTINRTNLDVVDAEALDMAFEAPTKPQLAYDFITNVFMVTWDDPDTVNGIYFCGETVDEIPFSTNVPPSSVSNGPKTSSSIIRSYSNSGTNSVGAGSTYINLIPSYEAPIENGRASAERVTAIVVGILVPAFAIPILILGCLLVYFGYWKPKKQRELKLDAIGHELSEKEVTSNAKFDAPLEV